MALFCLVMLMAPVLSLSAHIPLNPNEGWNAHWALRALHPETGPLYPPVGGFIFNNYPPLSFYIVAAFSFVTQDVLLVGRIIAFCSFLGCGGLIYLLARLFGGGVAEAFFAAFLFILCATSFYPDYVGVNDPQWSGLLLTLLGLMLLRGREGTSRGGIATAGAASVFLLGVLMKHNIVALPLAVTVWLFLRDRRLAVIWCLSGMVGCGVAAAIFGTLDGTAMFRDVFMHKRLVDPRRALLGIEASACVAGMIPSVWLLWKQCNSITDDTALVCLFAVLALITGITQRMGEGVSYNAQFEVLVASCLATGLALSCKAVVTRRQRTMLALAALTPFLVILPHSLGVVAHRVSSLAHDKSEWQKTIDRIGTLHGSVACENPSLCYWAGKGLVLDFFNYNQVISSGASMAPFCRALNENEFDAFVLNSVSSRHPAQFRDPRPLNDFLRRKYGKQRTDQHSVEILIP